MSNQIDRNLQTALTQAACKLARLQEILQAQVDNQKQDWTSVAEAQRLAAALAAAAEAQRLAAELAEVVVIYDGE